TRPGTATRARRAGASSAARRRVSSRPSAARRAVALRPQSRCPRASPTWPYRRSTPPARCSAPRACSISDRFTLPRASRQIVLRGYQAVRILDLTKLAHVSRPTFYELYADKEELLLSPYNEIAERTAQTVLEAFGDEGDLEERLRLGMRAFARLAAKEPQSMTLFLMGAFGAGQKALARRKEIVAALEHAIQLSRDGTSAPSPGDLTVKIELGGIS